MVERMCVGCPFRSKTARAPLLRYIAADPDEMWPCHESAEFNDLMVSNYIARQLIAIGGNLVLKLERQADTDQ